MTTIAAQAELNAAIAAAVDLLLNDDPRPEAITARGKIAAALRSARLAAGEPSNGDAVAREAERLLNEVLCNELPEHRLVEYLLTDGGSRLDALISAGRLRPPPRAGNVAEPSGDELREMAAELAISNADPQTNAEAVACLRRDMFAMSDETWGRSDMRRAAVAAFATVARLRPAPRVPAELLARLPSAQWLDDLAAGRVGAMSQHARETYKLACEWLRGRPPAAPEAPRVLAEAPKAAAMADPAPASPTTRAAIPES
jgi:hypothetical protein